MRKLFGTDGIRGVANEYPMTAETALGLGRALCLYLRKFNASPRIIVGKDTRRSGYMLENALVAGITSMGGRALILGPLPTPSVAYHICGMRAHGGVMISASHNPFEDNGLKVFGSDGFKLSDEAELEIEAFMADKQGLEDQLPKPADLGKASRVDDAKGRFLVNLKTIFRRGFELEGMKIVFDGANGAAYDCGPRLFEELGADVVKINCSPNGYNINADCAQEKPEILEKAVKEHRADIGIGVDGDADRLLVVDETGQRISGEHYMYETACYLKEQGRLQSNCVVTTIMANQALEIALESAGIRCLRAQVGDRYVTQLLKEESGIFGGETSGHFIFLDQNTTACGLFSALEVLSLLQHRKWKASRLRKAFDLLPQRLVSIPVKEKKPIESIEELAEAIREIEQRYKGKGRVNVRYSGTQLVLRVMVEGPDAKVVEKDMDSLEGLVLRALGNS